LRTTESTSGRKRGSRASSEAPEHTQMKELWLHWVTQITDRTELDLEGEIQIEVKNKD